MEQIILFTRNRQLTISKKWMFFGGELQSSVGRSHTSENFGFRCWTTMPIIILSIPKSWIAILKDKEFFSVAPVLKIWQRFWIHKSGRVFVHVFYSCYCVWLGKNLFWLYQSNLLLATGLGSIASHCFGKWARAHSLKTERAVEIEPTTGLASWKVSLEPWLWCCSLLTKFFEVILRKVYGFFISTSITSNCWMTNFGLCPLCGDNYHFISHKPTLLSWLYCPVQSISRLFGWYLYPANASKLFVFSHKMITCPFRFQGRITKNALY